MVLPKKPRFQGGGSSHINCFKITNALELFLLMHRLFTQKDFLLIKIYTMKNWLLKHFRLQKLLIRL